MSQRLHDVRTRIERAGGDPARVTIVAVTKGFGREAVAEAAAAGITDFGENQIEQLLRKRDDVHRWHFLGRIQRRDVRRAEGVHLWQSVDRAAAGAEIAKRWPGASVLVEVNVTGDAKKLGCRPQEAPALVKELRAADLDVQGVMAIGSQAGLEAARRGFRDLSAVADDLELPVRSMGMSDDLEVAVQEGSTMVRIGRALFGPRPDRPAVRR